MDNNESTIMGMNMCIGIAISQDGIHWGRMEGDNPNGSILSPDDDELYCAWPDVVHKEKEMNYILHYSTMKSDTKQKCIHYATSKDGFRWEKKGVCLEPSLEEDQLGC